MRLEKLAWICEFGRMRQGVEVRPRPSHRDRFEGTVCDRKSPQHQIWRSRIELLPAYGAGKIATRAAALKDRAPRDVK
jgi:hypothetical protein